MTVFWAILAVLALVAPALGAYVISVGVLAIAREPVWHPGDEVPDVPQDAAIRRFRG